MKSVTLNHLIAWCGVLGCRRIAIIFEGEGPICGREGVGGSQTHGANAVMVRRGSRGGRWGGCPPLGRSLTIKNARFNSIHAPVHHWAPSPGRNPASATDGRRDIRVMSHQKVKGGQHIFYLLVKPMAGPTDPRTPRDGSGPRGMDQGPLG